MEEERYSGQLRSFSSSLRDGRVVQQKLSTTHLTAFGAGLVASYALSALAEAGIGTIRIVDDATSPVGDLPSGLSGSDEHRMRAEALAQRINGDVGSTIVCQSVAFGTIDVESVVSLIDNIDVVLVCLDAPSSILLDVINRATLRTNTSWITGQVHSGIGWIGPTVIPGVSPCYKCYELRRNANLQNYDEVLRYESRLDEMPAIVRQPVAPYPLIASAGALLALEALRLLTGIAAPQTLGRVLRLDFFSSEMKYHRILRLPRCPACGYGTRAISAGA